LFIADERAARWDRDTEDAPVLRAPIIQSLGKRFFYFEIESLFKQRDFEPGVLRTPANWGLRERRLV
jgi:hypothetical protein